MINGFLRDYEVSKENQASWLEVVVYNALSALPDEQGTLEELSEYLKTDSKQVERALVNNLIAGNIVQLYKETGVVYKYAIGMSPREMNGKP